MSRKNINCYPNIKRKSPIIHLINEYEKNPFQNLPPELLEVIVKQDPGTHILLNKLQKYNKKSKIILEFSEKEKLICYQN